MFKFKKKKYPALEAFQQKGQTTVFTLFQIVLFCLNGLGVFFSPKQTTKSICTQGNYKGIHTEAAEKLHLLARAMI